VLFRLPDTSINIITGGTTVNAEKLPDINTSIILDETSDTDIHTKLVSEETLNKAHILPDINTNSITAFVGNVWVILNRDIFISTCYIIQ
jgi:hypothetical protein